MTKLNDAILEAYEGYQTALDYVKGWKQEVAHRKSVVMALINVARKENPELGGISAKELFDRTAEMYEAAHDPAEPTEDPAEVDQTPDEVDQAPADTEEEQAPADDEPETLASAD